MIFTLILYNKSSMCKKIGLLPDDRHPGIICGNKISRQLRASIDF